MYSTGNPVPSSALEDMADNAQTFDALVTKTDGTTTDRLGRTRRVFQQILMDMGFQPLAGSFQTGATVTARNQCLQDTSTGIFYSWNGVLPKIVPAGSTPSTAGGIGIGLWSDKTDLMIRSELIAQGGVRFASACESIADLISLDTPINNQRVDVLGFYANSLRGGGTFRYNATTLKSTHDGITIISPTVPFDGLHASLSAFLNGTGETDAGGSGCWVRSIQNATVSTAMAGAVIDGIVDDTNACQAAHDTGLHVEYDAGNYLFSGGGVTPQAGQRVTAHGFGFFNKTVSKTVSITNNDINGGIFSYITDTDTSQKDAPRVVGFYLKADYPIRLNNHYDYIADGVSATNPYLMRPEIRDNYFIARSVGVGIGCVFAKCFDGLIANNEFYSFAINLVLLGSDINVIERNRFMEATLYHIYDRSAQSFGSQNEIRNNDILAAADGALAYIKTSARHVRIYDNYLEKPSGSVAGFIDNSTNVGIIWNALNIEATTLSLMLVDNRLDGRNYCTSFVYRVNNTTPPVHTIIRESGTTGGESGTATVLDILGTTNGLLRYRRGSSNINNCEYDIQGSGFGRFNGFKTVSFNDSMQLNASNFVNAIGNNIYSNNAETYVRTNGESIVLLPGLTVNLIAVLLGTPDGVINPNFVDGVTYTVTVISRTTSPSGDTLRVGRHAGGTGAALNDVALSTQFKKFTFTMVGAAPTTATGVYLSRSTFNGNIEIKSISFSS